MKKLSFPYTNSVYLRIFISFIFILIPILAIGTGIYSNGIHSINTGIASLTQAQNDTYLKNFENEVRRIKVLQYDLYNDENLLFLTTPTTALDFYNRDQGLLRLQQRLDTIKSSSRFIEDVKVYIPSVHLLINPATNSDTSNNVSALTTMFSEASLKQIFYWNGKLIMTGAYPLSTKIEYPSSLFAIEIDFSSSEIQKMLEEIDTYKGSGSFLLDENANFTFTSSKGSDVSKGIISKVQSSIGKASTAGNPITSSSGRFIPVQVGNSRYFAVFTTSNYLNATLVHYIPEDEIFSEVHQFRIWIWALSITSLIIIIIFSFSLNRFIHRPLSKLVGAFRKVKTGDLEVRIQHGHKDEFKYIYESFNDMVENLHILIEQSYKYKILAQKAELKQLQSQINPHFLYNSFFILQKRIKYGDNENALVFAERLGEFFQFITRNAQDEVPLSKEVEHARIYAELQASRFSRRIKVTFDELPKELENIPVPRVILQPVIENAFEHSLEDMEENGKLAVSFEEKNKVILIHVENNGEELSQAKYLDLLDSLNSDNSNMETTGLVNIHRRLRLKFGEEGGILINPGSEGGLRITLVLKKEEA